MLNNSFNPNPYLIPNPMIGQATNQFARNTLNLSQIEDFNPIGSFSYAIRNQWNLVKSSVDSAIEIPDPKSIQIIDYWNHVFPNLKEKVYIYVVEGIKPPRVETEQPTRILYQWFSTSYVPNFTPLMITEREWRKANVYAAPVVNSRMDILNNLCQIQAQEVESPKESLIKVEGINHGTVNTGDTRQVEPTLPRHGTIIQSS